MQKSKMYFERPKNGNIPVMRYCVFSCVYCNFRRFLKLSPCEQCKDNAQHTHMEVLQRTPPKTKPGQFLTVGLSGDVSFMEGEDFDKVLDYCRKWWDRTLLIQSKNPEYFLQFAHRISDNVILGTTIETTYTVFRKQDYYVEETNPHEFITYKKAGTGRFKHISEAPLPHDRYASMVKLACKKAVTIEPILDFDLEKFTQWIKEINPLFCYVGYANDKHEGKKMKLPEPPLEKTMQLIDGLRNARIEVREKTLRKAWYEE